MHHKVFVHHKVVSLSLIENVRSELSIIVVNEEESTIVLQVMTCKFEDGHHIFGISGVSRWND
jgi:hypothetical protein